MARERVFDTAGAHASLRFLTVSGGDLAPAQHARLPELARGVQVFKTYGQTEAFRIASLPPEHHRERPTSIGKALPGGHLYVTRPDLTLAEPGEIGEVVHTGVGTMLGYLDGADAEKLRPNPWRGERDPNELAIFTGDLGQLDEQGFLQLVGRRDDMVKISGNRVYPSEVKALIAALPDVATAEVVAVRLEGRVELAAFVALRAQAAAGADELRRALQERAPSYMVPTLLLVRHDLPRTESGKPDRTALAHEARALLVSGSRVA